MLREQITGVAERIAGAPPPPALRIPKMQAAAERVSRRHSLSGVARVPPDLDTIAKRLRDAASTDGRAVFRRRDLKYAPHCFWAGRSPIAESDDQAMSRILTAIVRSGRRRLVSTLAVAYLRHFRSQRPGVNLAGQAIRNALKHAPSWVGELSRRHSGFDHQRGPKAFARACLKANLTPGELLQQHGLDGDILRTGFAAEASRRGLREISSRLESSQSPDDLALIERWSFRDSEPRFDGAVPAFARAALRPFLKKAPNDRLQRLLLDAVLTHVGDPRLHPQHWQQIEEERDLVRRWLTGQSLRQFLDIVDEIAQPDHWRFRRAFWEAFYEAGLLEEAWVAFGPEGRAEARRVFGKMAGFAELRPSRKPVEGGHAVLLMRIGDLVVCDWSHNGRCIIWPSGGPGAPILYRRVYYSGDLAPQGEPPNGFEISHHSSQRYHWQRQVSDFIRRRIGRSVDERQFQVRP